MPPPSSRRGRLSQRHNETPVANSPRPPTAFSSSLPPYEAPVAPLNAKAQIALSGLFGGPTATRLQKQITDAASLLHSVAGDLNDYGAECREIHLKKKARRGNEEDAEAEAEHEAREKNIEDLTRKLDLAVRKTVDEEVFVGAFPEMMQNIANQSGEGHQAQTQSTLATQTQQSRNRRPHRTMTDGEDDDQDDEPLPPDPPLDAPPSPSYAPSALLTSAVETHATDWSSKSLYTRYANHNTYIAFKQSVHDAQHNEENAPPLPSRKTWFVAEDRDSDRKATARPTDSNSASPPDLRRGTVIHRHLTSGTESVDVDEDIDMESSDVEIRSERISTKCPITFLPFQDPLTSTKCPHSFEAHAILAMLERSTEKQPLSQPPLSSQSQASSSQVGRKGGGWQKSVKVVKCPICSTPLAKDDLRPDPVLARKVRRLEARETQRRQDEEEEEEDEDEGGEEEEDVRGTQRRSGKWKGKGKSVLVGSSPLKSHGTVMGEALSARSGGGGGTGAWGDGDGDGGISGTQSMTPGGAMVVDLGGEDEDEDEDEDEVEEDEGEEEEEEDEDEHMSMYE